MVKLDSLVVDTSFRLIGFVLEGSPKDFGEFAADNKVKVHKTVSLSYLFNSNFVNKQISMQGNTIVEKEGFKLSSLKMLMFNGNEYISIDNTIKLVRRHVQNNENVGFDCIIGGKPVKNISYVNVINLCNMFKPVNFVVRNSTNNKKYIAGKTGETLSSLEANYIGDKPVAKRLKSSATDAPEMTGDFKKDIDIFELYDFIRGVNGFIVNLPGTKYKATTNSPSASEEFVPFNIGEVGSPWLDFNETKFNISCNFKRPGAVAVKFENKTTNVITFIYRRKNIFYDGKNYISRLGVVIPNSAEESLISTFGKTMTFTEIVDPGIVMPISMLIAQTNVKMYEVDTSKVAMMTKEKAKKQILSCEEIYDNVRKLTENKFRLKFLNGELKDLKANANVPSAEKIRGVAPQFAAMSNAELEILTQNGIDIYSGAFTSKEEYQSKPKEESDAIEIQYIIEGLNVSSVSYKDMVNESAKVPEFMLQFISKIKTYRSDLIKYGEILIESIDRLNKENSDIKRRMWLHRIAMYTLSNMTSIHSHDKDNWELNTKKRTKATCYNCKVEGCERLQLLVSNVLVK